GVRPLGRLTGLGREEERRESHGGERPSVAEGSVGGGRKCAVRSLLRPQKGRAPPERGVDFRDGPLAGRGRDGGVTLAAGGERDGAEREDREPRRGGRHHDPRGLVVRLFVNPTGARSAMSTRSAAEVTKVRPVM